MDKFRAALYGSIILAISGGAAAIASSAGATAATALPASATATRTSVGMQGPRGLQGLTGAAGAAGPAGERGPAGARGFPGESAHVFKWVDSKGATVGPAAPYSQSALVTIAGERYAVAIFRWGDFSAQLKGHWNIAQPGHNEALRFYENEDCTGRPYFDSNPELGATAPAAMDWHADGSTDIITLEPSAHVIQLKCSRAGNGDMQLYPAPYWAELYAARDIYSMDLMFPGPLSFE